MFNRVEEIADGQLIVSQGEGVALLELNRPDSFNALSVSLLDALVAALSTLSEDPTVSAIVLTGRGKAFSVGVDLKELASGNGLMESGELGPGGSVMRAFNGCQKPIIGAVNGFAVTGGFEIALACDFLYAAESARFADTHARVGLIPGWGLSQKLPRLVGINRAREISFTGNYFGAADAEAWGLVNRVCSDNDLLAEALDTAHQIATALPEALFAIKAMMNEGWEDTLGHALVMEGERSNAYNSSIDVSGMAERLSTLKARARK
ncbi:enoyl-CoA hydratase [Halioglobus japonicus]|uniref:Enoyl-CoA hydratase n=1 Tax=Halioglobus japonicus TaxID=930805 RepID=A0AAP8MHR8_9GAMM|nr:enoyl-CoA hydratase [Halioglobus japonicus]PLW88047.1 enoyl-CoA hydratase [Halioglobus japonicus]GHD20579.1 enoyl-CoA hydratase [Halioglobus japonicus]